MKRAVRILLSFASGAIALILSLSYASTVRAEADRAQAESLARYGGDLVSVCVATRDIEPGETLDETDVEIKEWVASLLPPGAATSMRAVAGKQLTSRIPKSAVICPVYYEAVRSGIDVPRGRVALAIPVDEEHAVGGAVAAGDMVDIYISKDGLADRLCSARVIDSSARGRGAPDSAMKWVTVAIDPETVKEVLAAIGTGSVSLTLPGASAGAKSAEPTGGQS